MLHLLPPAGNAGNRQSQGGGSGSGALNDTPPPSPANEQTTGGNVHPNPIAVESAARCKLPVYWPFNPQLWFAQAEALFNANQVRTDALRYNLVVAHLPPNVAQEVADVILSPPDVNKYGTLKSAVLQRLAAKPDQQLHQLLNEVQLGDRTPSQLLRHMKRLGGDAMTDGVLKTSIKYIGGEQR